MTKQHGSQVHEIRFIALDLDDTVLLPDKTISERTKAAIRAAAAGGCSVILASARPIRSVLWYAEQLGIHTGYCIGLNGAVVARLDGKQIVRTNLLSAGIAREAVALAEEYRPDNCFLDFPEGFAARYDGSDVSIYTDVSRRGPDFIGDLTRLPLKNVCKVTWRMAETPFPMYEKLKERLQDRVNYVLWEGPWSFIEILDQRTSKASALAWIAETLGIPASQALAVGDQRNDREMLEWAGIGVAMGNAHPELKAVADDVTSPVTEDGCALAIEKYVGVEPS